MERTEAAAVGESEAGQDELFFSEERVAANSSRKNCIVGFSLLLLASMLVVGIYFIVNLE